MRVSRGIALLVAVLAVAIASGLIVALVEGGEDGRVRLAHALRAEQAWHLALGLERWAEVLIARERGNGRDHDSPLSPWFQPLPSLPVPGGEVSGRILDASGCFNLNALVTAGGIDGLARARFERLLDVLGLPRSIAAQAIDWIDPDQVPEIGGAEDLFYLGSDPPRRAANQPFVLESELLALPAVDEETFARLQPHVCALPDAAATINLNFASPELLMALDPAIDRAAAEALHREGRADHRSVEDFLAALAERGIALAALPGVAVESRFLLARAEVRIDGIPFVWTALLERDGGRLIAHWRAPGRP